MFLGYVWVWDLIKFLPLVLGGDYDNSIVMHLVTAGNHFPLLEPFKQPFFFFN